MSPCVRLIAAVLSLAVLAQARLQAQVRHKASVIVFAQLSPAAKTVHLMNPETGASRTIYRSTRWGTRDLTVSPTGAYFGLLEIDAGIVEGHQYRVSPRSELIVLDTNGVVAQKIARDVQRYAWCGSSCLVYVVGGSDETDLGFRPSGAAISDFVTGQRTSFAGPPWPYEVAWGAFDSSVYLSYPGPGGSREIFRFPLPAGPLTLTGHRDLVFSFDGTFYLSSAGDPDARPRVYSSKTDREVGFSDLDKLGIPVQWLPSGGSDLLIRPSVPVQKPSGPPDPRKPFVFTRDMPPPNDVNYVVYNVGARRVVRTLRGRFPQFSSPHDVVPFISGGRLNAIVRRP